MATTGGDSKAALQPALLDISRYPADQREIIQNGWALREAINSFEKKLAELAGDAAVIKDIINKLELVQMTVPLLRVTKLGKTAIRLSKHRTVTLADMEYAAKLASSTLLPNWQKVVKPSDTQAVGDASQNTAGAATQKSMRQQRQADQQPTSGTTVKQEPETSSSGAAKQEAAGKTGVSDAAVKTEAGTGSAATPMDVDPVNKPKQAPAENKASQPVPHTDHPQADRMPSQPITATAAPATQAEHTTLSPAYAGIVHLMATGDPVRDKAVALLAAQLCPTTRVDWCEVAHGIEQQLFVQYGLQGSGEGKYLRHLHLLWAMLGGELPDDDDDQQDTAAHHATNTKGEDADSAKGILGTAGKLKADLLQGDITPEDLFCLTYDGLQAEVAATTVGTKAIAVCGV